MAIHPLATNHQLGMLLLFDIIVLGMMKKLYVHPERMRFMLANLE